MVGLILFGALAFISVASAVSMLTSRNAVHAALFLVINFVVMALFYLGLDAPFLAMVQVTVYAGAIMVLFLFVIMLLGAEEVSLQSQLRGQTAVAVLLVALLIGLALFIFFSSDPALRAALPPVTAGGAEALANAPFGSPRALGAALFTGYALPMQMVAVLLLVAMMGAVILAKEERHKQTSRVRRGPGAIEYAGAETDHNLTAGARPAGLPRAIDAGEPAQPGQEVISGD